MVDKNPESLEEITGMGNGEYSIAQLGASITLPHRGLLDIIDETLSGIDELINISRGFINIPEKITYVARGYTEDEVHDIHENKCLKERGGLGFSLRYENGGVAEFCKPLKLDDKIIGYVYLESEKTDGFNEQDMSKLILTLQFLNNAVSHVYQQKIDGLTKLPLRDEVEKNLETYFNYTEGRNLDLSVLMIDLDNFKPVNDEKGHQAGDEVIKQTADIIKNIVGKSKIRTISRLGGDEYIVAGLELSLSEAVDLGKKIRKSIEKHNYGIDIPISASIGVSTYDPNKKEETIESLINNDEILEHMIANYKPFSKYHERLNQVDIKHRHIELSSIREEINKLTNKDYTPNLIINGLIGKADEALYTAKKKGKNDVGYCYLHEPKIHVQTHYASYLVDEYQ